MAYNLSARCKVPASVGNPMGVSDAPSTGSVKVPCSKSLSAVKADEFPGVLGFGGLGPQVSVIRPESLKTGVAQSSSPR